MNRLIALAVTLTCFITGNSLSAQKYTIRESTNDLSGPRHEFFFLKNNEYVDVGYQNDIDKTSNIFVSCFDDGMKQQHTNLVADLAGKQYRGGFAFDNRLIAVVTDKDEKVWAQEINCKTGALIGAGVELCEMPGRKKSAFYKSSSASGNYYCVVAMGMKANEFSETFTGVVFDKQLKVISQFRHTVPNKLKYFEQVTPVVSDNGEITLIYSAYYQKNVNAPPVYTAVHVDKSGNTKAGYISGLPAGDLYSMDLRVKGNTIEFAGLLLTKLKHGFHTLVTGQLDPVQQKVIKIKESKLADHVIVPGYYKEKFKTELIPYPGLLMAFFDHKDGSRTLVYEEKNGGARVVMDGAGPAESVSIDVSYYARKIYVMKLSAANELQWIQVIGKGQSEGSTDFHIGSASFMDDKENLHIIFYDHPKNTLPEPVKKPEYESPVSDKTGLAVVQVAPDGKMTKQFITEKKDSKYHFTPKHVVSPRQNELLFLSIYEKGWQVNGAQGGVYRNSKWHLGLVKLQ
jgi:hypothetical protein